MTLAEMLPSLRPSLRPRLVRDVWPATARWGDGGDLVAGGCGLGALATQYGTPAHILDEADVRATCARYVATFGPDAVSYAAKAGLPTGLARWIAEEGLGCYVGSVGELRVALRAGFAPERITLFGHGKTVEDLDTAYACGAAIVVDSLDEIASVAARAPVGQRVLVRVVAAPSIGNNGFGLRPETGAALRAVEAVLAAPNLVLAGLDYSIGHQVRRFGVFEANIRTAAAFCAAVHARYGVAVPRLNLGGGHPVAYSDPIDALALEPFAMRIRAMLRLAAERHRISVPRLSVSPGRAVVSRAGVTLYRVAAVTSGGVDGLLVAVDGGLTDCPPAAACEGRHTAVLVGPASTAPVRPAAIIGRHNEAGDVMVPMLHLPADVAAGDLLAVAGTGAYHHSRASNYQLVARPPVLGVHRGQARVLVRRESMECVLRRFV